jgi:hypothetical protein
MIICKVLNKQIVMCCSGAIKSASPAVNLAGPVTAPGPRLDGVLSLLSPILRMSNLKS